jgi:hypothetical protein
MENIEIGEEALKQMRERGGSWACYQNGASRGPYWRKGCWR